MNDLVELEFVGRDSVCVCVCGGFIGSVSFFGLGEYLRLFQR